MAKTVVVFGATGQEGSSVIDALLKDPSNYKVKAVTSNINSPISSKLKCRGIDVTEADLTDRETLANVIKGAYGCYLLTSTDFNQPNAEDMEVSEGESVVDVCLYAGVKHIVFSGLPHARAVIGVSARHMDSKARIEDYLNQRSLPRTTIILPVPYESFLDLHRPKKIKEKNFEIGIPMGGRAVPMFSLAQVGDAVKSIFDDPQETLNKTYCLAGDKKTVSEIAQLMTKYLEPNVITDSNIDLPQYRNQEFPGALDISHMYEVMQRVDLRYNQETTKKLVPNVLTFETWLKENKEKILSCLEK